MSAACSIVIPNYNGLPLLQRCIPSLFDAIKHETGEFEVIVVDNHSEDGSGTYLQELRGPLQVLQLPENVGFARACNLGAAIAKYDILLFLNNDMYFAPDFLGPLLRPFKHYPDLFSVSPQIRDWHNRLQAGRVYGHFILGSFVIKADPRHYERLCYTLYTSGAASAVKRDKFIALGGFDEYLYIYEDVDLSYRAWKRGWTAFYEPRSVVYHKGRATSKALFPDPRYLTINLKNRHWFIWKNLTDHAIQRRYWALLPLSLAFFTLRMHSPAPLFAFKEALEGREHVLKQSTQELSLAVRTDVEVLNFVKDNIYVNE